RAAESLPCGRVSAACGEDRGEPITTPARGRWPASPPCSGCPPKAARGSPGGRAAPRAGSAGPGRHTPRRADRRRNPSSAPRPGAMDELVRDELVIVPLQHRPRLEDRNLLAPLLVTPASARSNPHRNREEDAGEMAQQATPAR